MILFLLRRYDSFKLQRLQQKKLDRQEARMEKEMFVGRLRVCFSPPDLCPQRETFADLSSSFKAQLKPLCVVDDVPFGEVVLAPPSLSAKPKKAQVKSQVSSRAAAATS